MLDNSLEKLSIDELNRLIEMMKTFTPAHWEQHASIIRTPLIPVEAKETLLEVIFIHAATQYYLTHPKPIIDPDLESLVQSN